MKLSDFAKKCAGLDLSFPLFENMGDNPLKNNTFDRLYMMSHA